MSTITRETSEKFYSALKKYRSILIVIKGSPDPDAIASAFAVKTICDHSGIKCSIISPQKLSLPQNKFFVKTLKIPVRFTDEYDISGFESYAVLDHQSARIDGVSETLPCVLHIDHHEKAEYGIQPDFKLISSEAGSTCTMIALILRESGIELEPEVLTSISTALLYGIQTDTDKYEHAGKTDYEALQYLSRFSNSSVIDRIMDIPLSEKTIRLLERAISNRVIYNEWLMTGIEFIDSSNRDSIAIIADFLLKRENVSMVIVFAIIESRKNMRLDVSFRTENDNINLNSIIKQITPNGGGRKFKGAYQVELSYFKECPEKQILWETVKMTTIEAIKKSRDNMYLTELKSVYGRFKDSFGKFFQSNTEDNKD